MEKNKRKNEWDPSKYTNSWEYYNARGLSSYARLERILATHEKNGFDINLDILPTLQQLKEMFSQAGLSLEKGAYVDNGDYFLAKGRKL